MAEVISQRNSCSKTKFQRPTNEQVSFVRKQLETTEQEIEDAVASLRSWLHLQPHLPDAIDDARIERIYINCKCSVERTKRALDAYFSLKHKLPELLMNRNPSPEFLASVNRCVKIFVMPGMTPKGYRVLYAVDVHPNPSVHDPLALFKTIIMWEEVMLVEDYSLGDIIVYDAKNVVAEHVIRTGLNNVRALDIIRRNVYIRRIKAFHILNAPRAVDMILTLLTSAFPKKLKNRIVVHQAGSKTLLDHLSPEYVPDELGGTGGAVKDLSDQCFELLGSYRQWFLKQDQFISNESRRPLGSIAVDDCYGVDGSFKKLSVD